MPTSLRRSLMVCVATSPTCATNFSFRLSACSQPVARAQVRRDVPALAVERAVHVDDGLVVAATVALPSSVSA